MIQIVLRRLVWLALLVGIVTALTYTLFFVVPGDPAVQAVPRGASPQTLAETRHRMGLDQPLWRQYLNFFHGPDLIGNGEPSGVLNLPPNLGYSFKNQEPVLTTILDRLPVTLSLAGGAIVLWLLFGLSVGVMAAVYPRSLRDRVSMAVALVGVAMPQFLLGIGLIYLLYFRLGIFPAPGLRAADRGPAPVGVAPRPARGSRSPSPTRPRTPGSCARACSRSRARTSSCSRRRRASRAAR